SSLLLALTLVVLFISSFLLLDLLSFPTRRSSDLGSIFTFVYSFKYVHEIFFGEYKPEALPKKAHEAPILMLLPTGILTLLVGKRDRKSTRLNSSHVSISYAVFCL